MIIILIFCFSFAYANGDNCEKIYGDEIIDLCARPEPDFNFGPAPNYSIYALNKKTNEKFFIDYEIDIEGVKNITQISSTLYFYKAYRMGNSPNAENRHILLVFDGKQIINAGSFAGYEDIDSDGVKDFFTWEISELGRDSASHEYKKAKMVLKNNKLIVQK